MRMLESYGNVHCERVRVYGTCALLSAMEMGTRTVCKGAATCHGFMIVAELVTCCRSAFSVRRVLLELAAQPAVRVSILFERFVSQAEKSSHSRHGSETGVEGLVPGFAQTS